MKTQPYLNLERRILNDEKGGVFHRWQYGRQLLEAKAGRAQLPHGMAQDLVTSAEKRGLKLSEREIQYRVRCAETYETEAEVRSAAADFGSWRALCDAGFPAVQLEIDPEEIAAEGLADAPDSWEQMQLDIPGLKEEIAGVDGQRVKLVKGEGGGTIADVAAYLEMCEEKHENFGKTIEHIRESLRTMREGADDEGANAVEAWEAVMGSADDEAESDESDEDAA